MLYKKVNQDFLSKTKNDSCEKKSFLRPCDADTYFQNIIFSIFPKYYSYVSMIISNCLLAATKSLKLKFLTESKVKKMFV